MSETVKEAMLKTIAFIAKKSAKIGCNTASVLGYHQPKEPANLKKMLEK